MRCILVVLAIGSAALVPASDAAAQALATQSAVVAHVAVPWQLKTPRSSITPSTRTIKIRVKGRACGEFEDIKVVRTPESVSVTAADLVRFVEQTSPYVVPPPCATGPATVQTVRLKGKLGRRVIVDGQRPRTRYARGVVPPLGNEPISLAYADLHAAGYRVAIPGGFSISPQANCVTVSGLRPQSYTRRRSGATVSITSVSSCPLGSIATTADSFRQRLVPAVTGESPQKAVSKLEQSGFYVQPNYGPLPSANRPTLDANYVITQQSPAAGTLWQPVLADPFQVTPVNLAAEALRGQSG